MRIINQLEELIENSENIALFTHDQPDGDAIGSCLALKNFIEANYKNKKIDIFFHYDENISTLILPLFENEKVNKQNAQNYDLAIALDCNGLSRFSIFERLFKSAKTTVNIDHHGTNTNFANLNYVVPFASSTCEIVYNFILHTNKTIPHETSKFAYIGIITDTNCLQTNVGKKTFEVLSEIYKTKINLDEIKDYFFKNVSITKTILLRNALSSLKFYEEGNIAIMGITNKDYANLGATEEDTYGIIDYANNIEGVQIAAFLIEKEPNYYYVSLRSKGPDVSKIAKEFEGGGSTNVAAFQFTGSGSELIFKLLDVCKQNIIKTNDNEENKELTLEK